MRFRHHHTSVAVCAPGKLNLYLNVVAKRPDGFHELETLMISIGLYDTLRLDDDPSGELHLRCFRTASPGAVRGSAREPLPADKDNLVIRAAELLRETTGVTRGAHIDLFKRIPMAAGLAGGSSDAAAALVGLNRLWNLQLRPAELHALAARLGSDVAFFLCPPGVRRHPGAAVCRGRGEIIEPISLAAPLHFVIVRPTTGLSTALVFRHCHPGRYTGTAQPLAKSLQQGRLAQAARCFHNGLQEPAEELNGDVVRLRKAFSEQPFLGHQMSGSGTSYFGLCASREHARQLAARLRAKRIGEVFVVQSRP